VDAARQDLNSEMTGGFSAGFADFDAAVSNGASPEALASAYNAGDDVNLTLGSAASGYGVLAPAIFTGSAPCSLAPNSFLPAS
jgi:hypothetical protein